MNHNEPGVYLVVSRGQWDADSSPKVVRDAIDSFSEPTFRGSFQPVLPRSHPGHAATGCAAARVAMAF